MRLKNSIPLFYSVIISLIVFISISIIDYYILKDKHQSLRTGVIDKAQGIIYSLEPAIKTGNNSAIREIIEGMKLQIKETAELLRVSIILLPESYYHTSTESQIDNYTIDNDLKSILLDNKNLNKLQRYNTIVEGQVESIFQYAAAINPLATDDQNWFITVNFSSTILDKKFNDFRILLILISTAALLLTFLIVYWISSILSHNIIMASNRIEDIAKDNFQYKSPKLFTEIKELNQKTDKLRKTILQQNKTIKKFDEEQQNPLKNKEVTQRFLEKSNYLCVLIKLDYKITKPSTVNLKSFLIDILNLIIQTCKGNIVNIYHFNDSFLIILDADNAIYEAIQSIALIQNKIQTNSVEYKKFGISNPILSIAAHHGEIKTSELNDYSLSHTLIFGTAFKLINLMIDKTQPGEILVTQEIVSQLQRISQRFVNINFDISLFGKSYNLFLLGKNAFKESLIQNKKNDSNIDATAEKPSNPLSINSMLEETLSS